MAIFYLSNPIMMEGKGSNQGLTPKQIIVNLISKLDALNQKYQTR